MFTTQPIRIWSFYTCLTSHYDNKAKIKASHTCMIPRIFIQRDLLVGDANDKVESCTSWDFSHFNTCHTLKPACALLQLVSVASFVLGSGVMAEENFGRSFVVFFRGWGEHVFSITSTWDSICKHSRSHSHSTDSFLLWHNFRKSSGEKTRRAS